MRAQRRWEEERRKSLASCALAKPTTHPIHATAAAASAAVAITAIDIPRPSSPATMARAAAAITAAAAALSRSPPPSPSPTRHHSADAAKDDGIVAALDVVSASQLLGDCVMGWNPSAASSPPRQARAAPPTPRSASSAEGALASAAFPRVYAACGEAASGLRSWHSHDEDVKQARRRALVIGAQGTGGEPEAHVAAGAADRGAEVERAGAWGVDAGEDGAMEGAPAPPTKTTSPPSTISVDSAAAAPSAPSAEPSSAPSAAAPEPAPALSGEQQLLLS
jgi:hypothetical protein